MKQKIQKHCVLSMVIVRNKIKPYPDNWHQKQIWNGEESK